MMMMNDASVDIPVGFYTKSK